MHSLILHFKITKTPTWCQAFSCQPDGLKACPQGRVTIRNKRKSLKLNDFFLKVRLMLLSHYTLRTFLVNSQCFDEKNGPN